MGSFFSKAKKSKKEFNPDEEPMTYLSYHGKMDYSLGISMFWADKFMIVLFYLERLALMTMWDLGWPSYFYQHTQWAFAFLLDLSAHHTGVDALGMGTIFEGCETVCKVVWPLFCLPFLLVWAALAMHKTLPLYYNRNIERICWTLVRIGMVPFLNTLVRYFILNQDGNVDTVSSSWVTPNSEVGTFIAVVTLGLYGYLGYVRSARPVLFRSQIRHEAFIRAREIEYKLKFSATFRNERMWMISSYTYAAWPWSLMRTFLDIILIILVNFVPNKAGIIIACVMFGFEFMYLTFVDVYRNWSSTVLEQVFCLGLVVFAVFGAMQEYGSRNVLLVGNNLDYFLLALVGAPVVLALLLMLYFFIDSHTFGFASIADKRANEKWKRTFGNDSKAGQWLEMDAIQLSTKAQSKTVSHEAFLKSDLMSKKTTEKDHFYLPKQASFFALNCASPHVWPVNGVMINEMLRRNEDDHLIDLLRAARKMLDRISIIHNSADLIPTDEIKTHITRLQQCVQYCKRARVTHHANALHPLQTTFEDMIEQFTFELRVFAGRSVTVGHNARKMIEVSRYLRLRMEARDRSLALVSPLMRRVLIKLLALRLFIQLVEERPAHLMPAKKQDVDTTNLGADILGDDSDEDSMENSLSVMNPNRHRRRRLRFKSEPKVRKSMVDVFDEPADLGGYGHTEFDTGNDEEDRYAAMLAKGMAHLHDDNNDALEKARR